MTRCPIMVTLTEGPNHVAHFKGSDNEYDLSKETDVSIRLNRNVFVGPFCDCSYVIF